MLSSLAVSGTAGFSTPTARTALEHVSVMQETIEHGGDSSAVTEQFVKPSLPRGRALHTTSALSRPHKVKVFEFSADLSHESEGSGGQIEREPTACSLDWAAWLYDLLKPQVSEVVVCSPRKNARGKTQVRVIESIRTSWLSCPMSDGSIIEYAHRF